VAILALPRLLGTAWESIGRQQHVLTTAWADGDMIQATARVLAMVAIVIPVAGTIYMLVRLARSTAVRSWHGSAGKPATRALVLVLGAAVLSAIAYAWWPREGTYRPIEASERGTLFDISLMPSVHTTRTGPTHTVTSAVRPAAAATLVKGQQGVMRTVWDTRTAAPTKQSPKLALVLVPKAKPWAGGDGGGTRFAAPAQMDKGWVFPVDKPLAPEPGDNQALAVNTIDGTVDYEAAFALVWQTDESYAMNVNEAQAYASCNSCASVAIAYQVVFVVDNDDSNDNVAVPQNLAGSLNYKCVNCLTYSLAKQLFVTLDEPLSDEAMAKLDVLWKEIAAYGEKVEAGQVPLNEIDAQLEKYNQQIKDIVEADQPGTFPSSPATPTPTVLATVTASPTPAPIPSATGSPTGSPTASATASLTPPPSLSAPSSPTQSATASPAAPSTGSSLPSGTSTATPSAPSNSTAPGGSATDGSTSGASTSGGSSSSGSTSGGS
jgi:putative peptide zinc metalloprotease protein